MAAARGASPLVYLLEASIVEVGSGSTHVEFADGDASGARRRSRRNLRPRF